MLTAELKGKIPEDVRRLEDVLTSYFFGTMKYLPPEVLLIPWASKIGFNAPINPKSEIHYSFWECLPDGTEPDLIIRFANQLIMVEVKYLSPLGADKDQLKREVGGGLELSRKEGLDFSFIALTHDYKEPQASIELLAACPPESLGYQCFWACWRDAYDVVEKACARYNQYVEILADLLNVVEKRGLKGFRGFKDMGVRMMKCREALEIINDISLNVSSMFQELDPLLEKLGFTCYPPLANTVISDGAYRNLREPRSWTFTYIARAYRKSLGETDPIDAVYFVKVRFDSDEPQLIVGGAIPMERHEPKPMEHTEVNGFFLRLRDHLEPFEEPLEVENPEFSFYRSAEHLIVHAISPLADIKEGKDIHDIVELFPVLRKALKTADRFLKSQQASESQ